MSRVDFPVALLGHAFMGRAHSTAYRHVQQHFQTQLRPELRVIAGRNAKTLRADADQLGWAEWTTDWREAIAHPDVQLVDVSTPGNVHPEQVIAAARLGKHIVCEKPLANSLREARAMLAAVRKAGVRHLVMHNYRRIPAVALARKIIDEGRLGRIFHFRAFYQQDWIVDPGFPLVWRLRKDQAGSGALGDIGSHIIDFARYLIGEIEAVWGHLTTFIAERPLPEELDAIKAKTGEKSRRRVAGGTTAARRASTPRARRPRRGKVTVEDAAVFVARFANGAVGTFEATRFATGHKNHHGFEIYGERGSILFQFDAMNELLYLDARDSKSLQGFRRIPVTEAVHPYMTHWWPSGHLIGYEHTFANTLADFLDAIAEDRPVMPDFEEGVKNQAVLHAVELSARNGRWTQVPRI